MTVENRKRIEREIVRAVVEAAVAKGYTFRIDNGGKEDEIVATSGVDATMKEMFQTDYDKLYVITPSKKKIVGWVSFVYGNDGWDVICDYSVKVETLLARALKIADGYQ